jgi:hypothetical protein
MAKRAPKLNYQTMPPQLLEGPVSDRQAQFRKLTRSAPAERASERAFLASKLTMLRTHPGITEEKRASGEASRDCSGQRPLKRSTRKRLCRFQGAWATACFTRTSSVRRSPAVHRDRLSESARRKRQ